MTDEKWLQVVANLIVASRWPAAMNFGAYKNMVYKVIVK